MPLLCGLLAIFRTSLYSQTKGIPEFSISIMKSRSPGALEGVSVNPMCVMSRIPSRVKLFYVDCRLVRDTRPQYAHREVCGLRCAWHWLLSPWRASQRWEPSPVASRVCASVPWWVVLVLLHLGARRHGVRFSALLSPAFGAGGVAVYPDEEDALMCCQG